jgi:hypothetical protein
METGHSQGTKMIPPKGIFSMIKRRGPPRYQWLTPVILVTWEAEIGNI